VWRAVVVRVSRHDRQLRARLLIFQEALELAVDEFEPSGDLLAAVRPALLPLLEFAFGGLCGRSRLIEILLQSQERFSQL